MVTVGSGAAAAPGRRGEMAAQPAGTAVGATPGRGPVREAAAVRSTTVRSTALSASARWRAAGRSATVR